jgi:hypothetical protein
MRLLGKRFPLSALVFGALGLYLCAFAVRIYARKYYLFLPAYVRWAVTPAEATLGPKHIFFVFVDHFEPDYDREKTANWAARYVALANRHHDSDGRRPQHTWFYPGEQDDGPILDTLHDLMTSGYGEVELHLHHGFDDDASLTWLLENSIADFQHHGFLKTVDGQTRFAFVHGNFSLDNGNGDWLCGVNDEIALLRRLGCFADFTFPSVYLDSQPSTVNQIYATKDDPGPKSYNRVLPLRALKDGRADIMIFEGPTLFVPSLNPRRLFLDLDDGDIHPAMEATARRVDQWVKADVHVEGRPDWIFVKVFAHGVSSPAEEEAVVGRHFDETLSYLERQYGDGHQYVLHYVTAREAYNLAVAASDGQRGNPEQYYDRPIPPYIASAPRADDLLSRQGTSPN